MIEEQEKLEKCFDEGELDRRLAGARLGIWYVPALAGNDVARYGSVRNALVVDAFRALEIMITTRS